MYIFPLACVFVSCYTVIVYFSDFCLFFFLAIYLGGFFSRQRHYQVSGCGVDGYFFKVYITKGRRPRSYCRFPQSVLLLSLMNFLLIQITNFMMGSTKRTEPIYHSKFSVLVICGRFCFPFCIFFFIYLIIVLSVQIITKVGTRLTTSGECKLIGIHGQELFIYNDPTWTTI